VKGDDKPSKPTKPQKSNADPRDSYRPKVFTDEEKTKWKQYALSVNDFYGELIMKQIN